MHIIKCIGRDNMASDVVMVLPYDATGIRWYLSLVI